MPVISQSLGKRSLLVLTRPSGSGAHHPVADAQGLYEIGIIREGLPVSREPALLGH